ncbi:FAD-binding oxidoreductase [Thermoleophilia bacterium SCSIO 60948]|nr:FAD-binding oxidoreductase [Thermoleophilia bacterium SCSIO 60948]
MVGAGIVGLATAYSIVREGGTVRVFESGRPGNGQSGGEARIFRHAHDDPRLARFTLEGRAIWDEWADQLGVEELVSADGVVAIGPSAEERLGILEGVDGIDARMIDGDELAERLPILAAYDGPTMLDVRGGSIRTTDAIGRLAESLGERIVSDEVISIRTTPSGSVEVVTGGETTRFRRVVVAAGRDTARLARMLGVEIPLALAAHARMSFAVRGDPPPVLACLQDGDGRFGESGVYAAASPGNRVFNVGLSQTTPAREDGTLLDPPALSELARRAAEYVSVALPGLDPEPIDVRNCWVTELTGGSDAFGVWEAPGALIPAGHNLFKQAPALGRELARAALGHPLREGLRPEAGLGAQR